MHRIFAFIDRDTPQATSMGDTTLVPGEEWSIPKRRIPTVGIIGARIRHMRTTPARDQ